MDERGVGELDAYDQGNRPGRRAPKNACRTRSGLNDGLGRALERLEKLKRHLVLVKLFLNQSPPSTIG
jgi:hypothetical protein